MKNIEYVRFTEDVRLLDIRTGDTFRVYYDKSCTRYIKLDDLVINVDKRKNTGCMELIIK
jgi:hypothetical protein